MKKALLFLLLVLFTLLWAQSDYETWKAEQKEQMQQFKNEQDRQFAEFLEKNWKAFNVFKGEKLDEVPKPIKVPKVEIKEPKPLPQKNIVEAIEVPAPTPVQDLPKEKKIPEVETKKLENKATVQSESGSQAESTSKIVTKPKVQKKQEVGNVSQTKATNAIQINFFQKNLRLGYDKSLQVNLKEPIDNKKIAEFWKELSQKEFETVLKQLRNFKQDMELNDWGYVLLLYKAGEQLYEDKNLATLFTWFMLTQSGYKCKIGYNDEAVKLLLASGQVFFGKPYLKVEGQRYYAVSFQNDSAKFANLYTYEGNHADAKQTMNLFLQQAPALSSQLKEKIVEFEYRGEEFKVKLVYNPQNIEYYDVYPNTNLNIYFDSPMKREVEYEVLKQLKQILEGRSQAEAANILLRFVQTGFQYKTDAQQFGREKAFFPEETLYYPYCDCEDRSVLFSYLVRKLLKLEVLGLDYPGHVATAVRFQEEIPGDAISYDGKRYVICDPTYINADLGMAMPEFKDKKPQIIQVR